MSAHRQLSPPNSPTYPVASLLDTTEAQRARLEELKLKVEAFLAKYDEREKDICFALQSFMVPTDNSDIDIIAQRIELIYRVWLSRMSKTPAQRAPDTYDASLMPLHQRLEAAQGAVGLPGTDHGRDAIVGRQMIDEYRGPLIDWVGLTNIEYMMRMVKVVEERRKAMWEMNRALAELDTYPSKPVLIAKIDAILESEYQLSLDRWDVIEYGLLQERLHDKSVEKLSKKK